MDINMIPTLPSSLDTTTLAGQVSLKVLSMSLENLETSGEGMRKMLEMSVTPNIGGNIDISLQYVMMNAKIAANGCYFLFGNYCLNF